MSAGLAGVACLAAAAIMVGSACTVGRPGGTAPEVGGVPVLMYHRVDSLLSAYDPITRHLTVRASAFTAQLEWLAVAGYQSMSLDDLLAAVTQHAPLPARRVVLTFDDGYEDNYTVVFPLLRQHGLTATFFVVAGAVGTPDHLTVPQIREMAQAGMAIESHGVHHVDFSRLPLSEARRELIESRRMLGEWAGQPVFLFAYPVGRYSPALEELLRTLGYHGAVAEVPGVVTGESDAYALERVRVDRYDTPLVFAHKLLFPLRGGNGPSSPRPAPRRGYDRPPGWTIMGRVGASAFSEAQTPFGRSR